MLGSCDLLMTPITLVTQLIPDLLPLAIKYAPYALMFLEAPDQKAIASSREIDDRLAIALLDKGNTLPSVPEILMREMNLRANQHVQVVGLYLQSPQEVEKLQKWLSQYREKIPVKIAIGFCDFSNDIHYRQMQKCLVGQKNITFWANGPLDIMSSKEASGSGRQGWEELRSLAQANN